MDFRHIRAFIAVAEELHFGRAAKRLHIEQSPLSRTIRQLETYLGVALLKRTPRGAQLTPVGQVFLEDARYIVLAFDQAKTRVGATAAGYRDVLRIALTDGIGSTRLSALLALCREEVPDVSIRLFETSLTKLVSGLSGNLFDVGLSLAGTSDNEIVAEPVWRDPLVVALPARHPLLAFKEVPLEKVMDHPLVLCHPSVCEGCGQQVGRLLQSVDAQPSVAEYVTTHELMLALVAAGYGVGFSSAAHLASCRQAQVVVRPLADQDACFTTYLLRSTRETTRPLTQFIDRARRVGRFLGASSPTS